MDSENNAHLKPNNKNSETINKIIPVINTDVGRYLLKTEII